MNFHQALASGIEAAGTNEAPCSNLNGYEISEEGTPDNRYHLVMGESWSFRLVFDRESRTWSVTSDSDEGF